MKYPGPPGNDEVPVGSGRGRSDRGGVGSPKGGGLSEPDFSRSPSGEQDRVEDREGASDPGHHVGPAVGRMAASTSHGLDFSSRDHAGGTSSDSSPGTTVRRCWFRTGGTERPCGRSIWMIPPSLNRWPPRFRRRWRESRRGAGTT